MTDTLFSIDVDAHLKKAATHTFGSASHFPVELVRAALSRDAGRIEVQLGRHRVQVTDDGTGLSPRTMETLVQLLDPSQPEAVKEAAVEWVQEPPGYGLLAMLAPVPEQVVVETVSPGGRKTFQYRDKAFRAVEQNDLNQGTRVTLTTPAAHRDLERERQVMEVYCRGVRREVYLEGKLISQQPLLDLSQQLVSLSITEGKSKYISFGSLGIPREGDVCRIKLLDQGIPYRYFTVPPHRGLIFDAVVEYPMSKGEVTRGVLNNLAEYARQLYRWLGEHHENAPAGVQARIEELMFSHVRQTGDDSLAKDYPFFPVHGPGRWMSLSQLKHRASGPGPIFAIPRKKEKLRYLTSGRAVLSLTREQADFLINGVQLPVSFLSPVFRKEPRFKHLFYYIRRGFRRLLLGLLPAPGEKQVVSSHEMSEEEKNFIPALNGYLSARGKGFGSGFNETFLVASSRPFAVIPVRRKKRLYIRRKHRWVKKAIRLVGTDRDNIEMVPALLKMETGG